MTTTDPKLIERAMDVWKAAQSAHCEAWHTFVANGTINLNDIAAADEAGDRAAAPIVAAAINEAAQKERARIWARMCSIEPDEELAGCPASWGDFLQILEGELAAASERRAAMDALIADSADMIDVHKESQP